MELKLKTLLCINPKISKVKITLIVYVYLNTAKTYQVVKNTVADQ